MPAQLVSDYLSSLPPLSEDQAPQVLVAESNHRIANNLTLISGLLRLQARDIAKAGRLMSAEDVCLLLEEVGARIETVGRLHRLLAVGGPGSTIDLGDYLSEVARAAVASMALRGEMALAQTSTAACTISTRQALPVGFIVGEIVTNAVKYAHPTRVAGRLELGCHRRPGGAVLIQIADDGVGLPEGFDPRSDGGLGMRVVRSLADQLGATLTFHSEEIGLTVRLLMPPFERSEAN